MKVFGTKIDGVNYVERPGAYLIMFNKNNEVALVEVKRGLFLPGGGIDPGEDDEACIKRELIEEVGWNVEVGGKIAENTGFVYSKTDQVYYEIQARYYIGVSYEKVTEPIEEDHKLVWGHYNEVKDQIHSPAQKCALEQAIKMVENEVVSVDEQLRLRKFQKNEYNIALQWYKDKEVLYFSEGDENLNYTIDTITRMYDYLMDIGELFFIEIYEEGAWVPIGDVTLSPNTMPITIGVPRYWGKGIGKKVIGKLLHRARENGYGTIRLKGIYKYNERSLRMFKGLGFNVVDETHKELILELIL